MATPAKKYIPGLGVDFKIQADEIESAVVIGDLTGYFATNVLVDAAFTAGTFGRDRLEVDALSPHGVSLCDVRQPTGIPLTASLAAGLHAIDRTTNVVTIRGELADGNTKTSVSYFQYIIPQSYKAGGLFSVRVAAKLASVTGTGVANNGSDIAVTVLKQAHGAVGANLVASGSPATYAVLDTWYDKDIVVTPTSLVPGDVLNIQITQRAIENDVGNGTLQSQIGEITILHDEQG